MTDCPYREVYHYYYGDYYNCLKRESSDCNEVYSPCQPSECKLREDMCRHIKHHIINSNYVKCVKCGDFKRL